MVIGILETLLGIFILALVFSAPFIGLYLTYKLLWPKLSPYNPLTRGKIVGFLNAVNTWISNTFEPLRPLYVAWMKIISGFSWLLARVVLTVAFFSIFLLYGVVLRLISKDPMSRRLNDDLDSYWKDNTVNNEDLTDFKTQY